MQFLGDTPNSRAAAKPGLVVPTEAVQANGETGMVYVIHGEKLERRTVRLGARNAQVQTVLSGVAAGDRLAIADFSKLADGIAVSVDP